MFYVTGNLLSHASCQIQTILLVTLTTKNANWEEGQQRCEFLESKYHRLILLLFA
ncbi:hypothetical protein GHT06_014678 [Daphnia sinensis]|uniref:Uncharacterized protein n=1 Tax=Daphnia sinensis TaxID=1820382 RepID=A0AAD5PS81_9CRUS|nr:hypothetical protein GHT06_014678 [Daphnia sinensis]